MVLGDQIVRNFGGKNEFMISHFGGRKFLNPKSYWVESGRDADFLLPLTYSTEYAILAIV